MEQNHIHTPAVTTDEPAASFISLGTSEPRSRRCRHDGWTPERQANFLEALAACGVVRDACADVGLSAQSAYAFRNRRAGRAFGTAWDAVLVHRARGRLSDELLSRAMNGIVEPVRDRTGAVTGERQRFDNRLSMAVLTRLDRLAQRVGARDDLLRAVSEDLDDFLDCVEGGGDADAFVEARRPQPQPEPEAPTGAPASQEPAARSRDDMANAGSRNDMDRLADLIGCPRYRDMDPASIDISDLPEGELGELDFDQQLRAHYSGYLTWLDISEAECRENGEDPEESGDRSPAMYMRRLRAHRRHYLQLHPPGAASAEEEPPAGAEPAPAPQPSTSSTYRDWSKRRPG